MGNQKRKFLVIPKEAFQKKFSQIYCFLLLRFYHLFILSQKPLEILDAYRPESVQECQWNSVLHNSGCQCEMICLVRLPPSQVNTVTVCVCVSRQTLPDLREKGLQGRVVRNISKRWCHLPAALPSFPARVFVSALSILRKGNATPQHQTEHGCQLVYCLLPSTKTQHTDLEMEKYRISAITIQAGTNRPTVC